MHLRPATLDDAERIAAIYNRAVTVSTASFDVEPKTAEDRRGWLAGRLPRHPVIVAIEEGEVIGWGALSPYSDRAAYATTAELSVYVDERWQQRGLGRALSVALLDAAAAEGLHSVLARICTENAGSTRMVRSLGFTDAGTMHEVGYKFGRWLDVATWEYRVPPVASVVSGAP